MLQTGGKSELDAGSTRSGVVSQKSQRSDDKKSKVSDKSASVKKVPTPEKKEEFVVGKFIVYIILYVIMINAGPACKTLVYFFLRKDILKN